jgi:nucleotide-binding universal stress UspA family protein
MTAWIDDGRRRIVVGVDGSAPSKAALAWAIGQARLTGAAVEAVIAWESPALTRYANLMPDVDWEELATQVLGDAVAEVVGSAEPVEIRNKIMKGNAAEMLLAESARADLLVVGNRGFGGFVGALLGSTGQHCVHHATCPVVVIRDRITGPGEGDLARPMPTPATVPAAYASFVHSARGWCTGRYGAGVRQSCSFAMSTALTVASQVGFPPYQTVAHGDDTLNVPDTRHEL